MRKILIALMIALSFALTAIAQDRVITGKVVDDKSDPVSGVSIVPNDGKNGTQSTANGSYSVKVSPAVKTITFSRVGYISTTATINGNVLDVTLSAVTGTMEDVVVTGYGVTKKKRDEAGAISRVSGAQLENKPIASFDKGLQGQAAGVLVQSNNGIPGGAINVRIRGAGSINAGNAPLYIVDGIQLNTRNDAAFSQSNPLSFLNPDDILSIDILKDAASAAIYGSNAANGVVIVTTKKGKAGKTKVTFNTYYGTSSPLKTLEVTNSQQYYQLRTEATGNANNLPANNLLVKRTVLGELRVPGAAAFTDAQADSAAAAFQTFDWQGEVFRKGVVRNYELAISGGNEKTQFRVSTNVTEQNTVITKADFNRYGIKFDLSNNVSNRLTVNTAVNLSTFLQNAPFATDGAFLGNPAFAAPAIIPTNPIYNADGSYYGIPGGTPANLFGTLNQNIVAVNDYNTGFQRTNQMVGSTSIKYKFTDWLSASVFAGLDYRLVQGKLVRDARTPDGFNRKGLVQTQSNWNTNVNTYGTLNYNKKFGSRHKIDGLVGAEYRRENNESISATGDGFPTFQFTSLNNAANPVSIGEFYTGFTRNALFGDINYNYDGRYLVGVVGRYDGSSRFGSGNKYGQFGGVKLSWNVDQEKFMSKISKTVSALRIRATYGSVGNDQIGNFDGLGLFGGGGVYNGAAGIAYSQLANPNLKWETSVTTNLGLDFGLFNDRVSGTVEVYEKKNTDLLLNLPLQSSTGFQSIASNVGATRNRGVELTFNVNPVRAKKAGDFNWNLGFIFAYNEQEVVRLFDNLKFLPDNSIRVSEPVGVLFTQNYAGVNAATGRPMWYDSTGNITYLVQPRDRKIIGPTLLSPYQGGLNNTFSFKGFTFDASFNYEYGRYATDGQVNFLRESSGRINFIKQIFDDRWTTPGQITETPRMNLATEAKSSGGAAGTRTWFKADYIRLRNVTMSYDVDKTVLSRIKLNSLRFYVQGTNLFTYSDWYSYDVEFVGVATGIIPQTKNITVGLQVGF